MSSVEPKIQIIEFFRNFAEKSKIGHTAAMGGPKPKYFGAWSFLRQWAQAILVWSVLQRMSILTFPCRWTTLSLNDLRCGKSPLISCKQLTTCFQTLIQFIVMSHRFIHLEFRFHFVGLRDYQNVLRNNFKWNLILTWNEKCF